jgi:hypothetical protein
MRTIVALTVLLLSGSVHAQTYVIQSQLNHVKVEVSDLRTDVQALQVAVAEIKQSVAELKKPETPKPVAAKPQEQDREWVPYEEHYLISEAWCQNCPAAKQQFLSKGWPEENIITMSEARQRFGYSVNSVPHTFKVIGSKSKLGYWKSKTKTTVTHSSTIPKAFVQSDTIVRELLKPTQGRYYIYAGRTYDLESWSPCGARWCAMCAEITGAQSRYFANRQLINATGPQNPTPDQIIERSLDLMHLTPSDVVAEIGCGDGRVMIAIAKRFGCKVRGVEIDPGKVDEARRLIAESGMLGQITVTEGDARTFPLDGVTAVYAYLESDLLTELVPRFSGIRTVVCPAHECPGLGMVKTVDGIWWRRS